MSFNLLVYAGVLREACLLGMTSTELELQSKWALWNFGGVVQEKIKNIGGVCLTKEIKHNQSF